MCITPFEELNAEAHNFRLWADTAYPSDRRFGEWEEDYPHWGRLYAAYERFLRECQYSSWNNETIDLLLYVLARDNESEFLLDKLAANPDRLLLLAKAALASPERDAKWQLVNAITDLHEYRLEVETLLLTYIEDDAEYVRRMALLGLGRIKSNHVERLAEAAWTSNHEYQRMAALSALKDVSSPKLNEYLKRAEDDGREYLTVCAERIRQGTID